MEKVAGNLQRIRNGERRYAITPRIPGGFVQPDMLDKITAVARKFHAVLKITGAQRIMITNLKAEDVNAAWEMLGMEPAYSVSNRVRSVKICPGTTFCKRAKQDSVSLGMKIERLYMSKEMPSKMKFGVSGCPNSCSEAITKDIGVIGQGEGWDVYAGGSAGSHPRLANFITHCDTQEEVLAVVARMVAYYKENAHIERMGTFIERIGIDTFLAAVLDESPVANAVNDTDTQAHATAAASADTFTTEQPATAQAATSAAHHTLQAGDPITGDTIVRELIEVYPQTIPYLQNMGMGCLGCPSATGEPLKQAALIHGVDIRALVAELEQVRQSVS